MLRETLLGKVHAQFSQRLPTKQRIRVRLSFELGQQFRGTGDGSQTRVDTALKVWLKSLQPAKL